VCATLIASGVSLMGCSTSGGSKAARLTVVPLVSVHGYLDDYGLPTALVEVGESKPLPVLVDTGSIGLRIIQSALSEQAQQLMLTNPSDEITAVFSDGLKLAGIEAQARFEIGGIKSTSGVPMQLVTSISCSGGSSNCPASYYTENRAHGGLDGILGIGMGASHDGLANPLEDLPGKNGKSWSIHLIYGKGGQLVLGANSSSSPLIHMQAVTAGTGQPYAWNDSPRLCWNVGVAAFCATTTFDSGSNFSEVANGAAFRLSKYNTPFGADVKVLTAGINVNVSANMASSILLAFNSGYVVGLNEVLTTTGSLQPEVEIGVQAFYADTLTYNASLGEISFS